TSNPTLLHSAFSNVGCSSSVALVVDLFWHSSHVFTHFSTSRYNPFHQYRRAIFSYVPFLPLCPLSSWSCCMMFFCSSFFHTTLFGGIPDLALRNNHPPSTKNSTANLLNDSNDLSVIPSGLSRLVKNFLTFFNCSGISSASSSLSSFTAKSASISLSNSSTPSSSEPPSPYPLLANPSGPPCFLPSTCLISTQNILIHASHL